MELFKLNPLDVNVVIETIKKFVYCPETLRSCRCVNQTWLREFNRKALCESTFCGLETIACSVSPGFSIFSEDRKIIDLNIRRLKVADKVEFLQHEKVVNFFELKGNQLRFMSFEAAKNDEITLVHVKFIENVLFKWCSQLEELHLVGLIENDFNESFQSQDVKNILLKKLVLNLSVASLPSNNMRMLVFQKILERAKNLDSFVFIGHQFDPHLGHISNKIVKLICENTRTLTTLEFYHVPIGKGELTLITTACLPLKRFIIDGLLDWDVKVRHVNLFLKAHAGSLKYFHFRVNDRISDACTELRLDVLKNLEVLKIASYSVEIGSLGLIGKLDKLHHLTLWGRSTWNETERLNFETMFANKVSSSIKTLCLDDAYVSDVSNIPKWCPFVSGLKINVSVKNIKDFLSNMKEMVTSHQILDDIKVTAHLKDVGVNIDENIKSLVTRLFRHKFRTIKITAVHDMDNFPSMRFAWIEAAFIGNDNTFFRIVLEGFYIREDEIPVIAKILTERANFTTWVDCKVIAMNTGIVIPLKEETFFRDNVDLLSKRIVKNVIKNSRTIAQLNFDKLV